MVQKEGYLMRLGRYIERNPIAAKVKDVTCPTDYKWSSASVYLNNENDELVDRNLHPYWEQWGKDDNARRDYYMRYIEQIDDDAVKMFGSNASIIGDHDFKLNLRLHQGRLSARKVGRPRSAFK